MHMLDDLLSSLREQTERSTPLVRVAALMRIARVETKLNPGQARVTFAMALEEIGRLSRPERDFLLQQARLLAAAVCPELIPELPSGHGAVRQFESDQLVRIMLEHGHHHAAITFAMASGEGSAFPFAMTANLIHGLEDQDARLALLRRAIEVWRASRDDRFIRLFQYQWKLLPSAEALEVAREIVRDALDTPDRPMTARYDEEGTVITSARENTLFQIWHVLRHLDPPTAELLRAGHEQLAAALHRLPDGIETIHQRAEKPGKDVSGQTGGGRGFVMAGDPKDFPYLRSLMQAESDGDFEPTLQHALDRYRDDTAPENPNAAPKEFWHSTGSFRAILHRAGKLLGGDAAKYLDHIPDRDLRLLAQIELAAALAGLPELAGPRRFHPSREARCARFDKMIADRPVEEPMRSPNGLSIRCPKCQWRPGEQSVWSCKCRHRWNTFSTGGRCPECNFQWTVTSCHRCGELSPHSEWYLQNETP
jgi:hypothetical protein